MICAVGGATILYRLILCSGWISLENVRAIPFGLPRWDFLYLADGLFFLLTMLGIILAFRPTSALFLWPSPSSGPVGTLKSIAWGIGGAAIAFVCASPMFWLVEKNLGLIPFLISSALSPLPILQLIVFSVAIALLSEIVFRGIVFRIFAEYASVPAALIASCLFFLFVCPVLGIFSATILSVSSAVVFYRTRNLISSVTTNLLFTLAGSGLTVYHSLQN